MRYLSLLFLVAAPTLLNAQTATSGAVLLQAPQSQDCPVGFSATHANQGAVVNVSPRSRAHEQGYNLTLAPLQDHGIAQARVTLHGLSGGQLLPARTPADQNNGSNPAAGKDVTETFTVAPYAAEKHLFHSTVYAAKLTGVQWIELNEVKYSDGTTWYESASSVCRVTPNGFMLVAGGK